MKHRVLGLIERSRFGVKLNTEAWRMRRQRAQDTPEKLKLGGALRHRSSFGDHNGRLKIRVTVSKELEIIL